MKCAPEDHHRDYSCFGTRIISPRFNEYMWKCKKCGKIDSDVVGSSIIAPETQAEREGLEDKEDIIIKWN